MRDDTVVTPTGMFQRSYSAGSFKVSGTNNNGADIYPPAAVRDLKTAIKNDTLELSFTAPGDDLSDGTATEFNIFVSDNKTNALTFCNNVPENSTEEICFRLTDDDLQNNSTLTPVSGGEQVSLTVNLTTIVPEVQHFLMLEAEDDSGHVSHSNIATVYIHHPVDSGSNRITIFPAFMILLAFVLK